MQDEKIESTYLKLIPFKKVEYWIFWPLYGFISLLISLLIFLILNEEILLVSQIIFAIIIGFGPTSLIYLSHEFKEAMDNMKFVFWEDEKTYENWIQNEIKQIFTLKTLPSKIVTLLVVLCGFITIIYLGIPFQSLIAKIFSLLGILFVFIISGQSAYISTIMMFTLREIVSKKATVPFYYLPSPSIRKFQVVITKLVWFVAGGYCLLIVAINLGPYQPSDEVTLLKFLPEMQIWLGVLALFPLGMIVWSSLYNYRLVKNIKDYQLRLINYKVVEAYNELEKKVSEENIERLGKLMTIQKKIQDIKAWPFEVQFILTFIISVITTVFQVYITLSSLSK